MVILGIDFGIKNIGLAIASGPLAEPLTQIQNSKEIITKMSQVCERLDVEKIVIGISEGTMASKTKKFATNLEKRIKIPVILQDETLTSKAAVRKLVEANAKKKKRIGPKHSFAAAIILQDHLDQLK